MSINITDFILNEESFNRMRWAGAYPPGAKYTDYRLWNLECIAGLTDEDRVWTTELCRRIKDQKISLMDEETGVVYVAQNIYFDKNKNLCITNPR